MKVIKSKGCISMAVMLILAVIVFVVGVGHAETNPGELGEGLTFVYANHGDPANPFIAKTVKGWNEAAAAFKVNATVNYAYGDISKQIDHVKAAIAMGVDGIFIFNIDPEGMHPWIEKALEKGIDVVVMSGREPVYSPEQVPFIGFDLEEQGYVLGKYMAKQLESGAHIAFFAEFIAPYSALRRRGFLKALDDAGITYTASDTFETGEELAKCIDIIKTYLLAHPETDAIIGLGSVSTPSGAVVLQNLRYKPGEIKWAGFDLLPETMEGIKAGYGASNLDEAFNYGFLACMALYLRAKYDFVIGDLPVGTVMVDKTNIKDYEYWVEKGIK